MLQYQWDAIGSLCAALCLARLFFEKARIVFMFAYKIPKKIVDLFGFANAYSLRMAVSGHVVCVDVGLDAVGQGQSILLRSGLEATDRTRSRSWNELNR